MVVMSIEEDVYMERVPGAGTHVSRPSINVLREEIQ